MLHRKSLNWSPLNLVDTEVRINVWTYLPNSVKEDVVQCWQACCFTMGCFVHAVLLSEMFCTSAQNYVHTCTHFTLARRTYFSLLIFSSVSLPFWSLFWPYNQVFQSTQHIAVVCSYCLPLAIGYELQEERGTVLFVNSVSPAFISVSVL